MSYHLPVIMLQHLVHQGKRQIALLFPKDEKQIFIFKASKEKIRIDTTRFFNNKQQAASRKQLPPGKANHPIMKAVPYEYPAMLKRMRYSESTIKTYISLFSEFINYFPGIEPEKLNEIHIRQYQHYLLINKKKVSYSTQNQAINAIKFYYEKVFEGSNATHLLEQGTDKRYVQEHLGHTSIIKTTVIYEQVSDKSLKKNQKPIGPYF